VSDPLSVYLIDQFDLTLLGDGYTNRGNLVENRIGVFYSTFNPESDQSSGTSLTGNLNTGSLWTPEDLISEDRHVEPQNMGIEDIFYSGLNTTSNHATTQVSQITEDPDIENTTVDEYLMHQTSPTPLQRCRKKKKDHKMNVEKTLKELDSEILKTTNEYEVLSANNAMLNDIWDTQVEVAPSIGFPENEENLKIILKQKAALLESKPPLQNKDKHYAAKRKRLLELEENEVTAKKFKVTCLVQETARLRSMVQRKKVQTKQIVHNRMLSG